jgi:hypothetical protein
MKLMKVEIGLLVTGIIIWGGFLWISWGGVGLYLMKLAEVKLQVRTQVARQIVNHDMGQLYLTNFDTLVIGEKDLELKKVSGRDPVDGLAAEPKTVYFVNQGDAAPSRVMVFSREVNTDALNIRDGEEVILRNYEASSSGDINLTVTRQEETGADGYVQRALGLDGNQFLLVRTAGINKGMFKLFYLQKEK